MGLEFRQEPRVDSRIYHGFDQRELANKPNFSRMRMEIVVDTSVGGISNADVRKAIGRNMRDQQRGIVDRVDFRVNPQQYRVTEPTREGITQTISGAWVDYYGLGLPKIKMSGTTGYNPNHRGENKASLAKSQRDKLLEVARQERRKFIATLRGKKDALKPKPSGLQDFIRLRNRIFRTYAILLQKLNVNFSKRIQSQIQLRLYSWDTEDFYIVLIDSFDLIRNASRPLLYDYNIEMTVIGYPDGQLEYFDYLQSFWSPTSRLEKTVERLRAWVRYARIAIKFVGAVSKTIKRSIAWAIETVDNLATKIEDFLTGAKNFIDTPLGEVRLIATGLKNLADSIKDLQSLPIAFRNDIHNMLVETICAVTGLATYKSIYERQYQDLFSEVPWKNLTCSSSLGIPPNPTLPEEGLPEPETEDPAGSSYPTPPSPPVARSGYSTQGTRASRLQEVDIKEGDTVESIISRIGGLDVDVAQVWQQIVTLNGLEYPYIAPDANFEGTAKSTTEITVYGTPGTVIPEGTRVGTQEVADEADIIIFVSTAPGTIGVDGTTTIPVEAERAGSFANVDPLALTQFIDAVGAPTTISGVDNIENEESASGGRNLRVLRPGQKLKIPVLSNTAKVETVVDRGEVNDENLFGNDIFLSATGDFISNGQGDLSSVNGLENMKSALIYRLQTERGALIKHKIYGTPVSRMVGEPGDEHALTVARLEITQTLLTDPRIKSVDDITVVKVDDVLEVDMNLVLIDEKARGTEINLPI